MSTLYYKDRPGKLDSVKPVDNADNVNTGLKERYNDSKESKMVSMDGKIKSDLFAQERYILGGVPIKLKLVRSSAAFSLVSSSDPATYKVVVEDCIFRVWRVHVSYRSSQTNHGKVPHQQGRMQSVFRPKRKLLWKPT